MKLNLNILKLENGILINFLIIIFLALNSNEIIADDLTLAKVIVKETKGISRALEYIDFQFQIEDAANSDNKLNIIAENIQNGEVISCQVYNKKEFKNEKIISLNVVFPISIVAKEQKTFILKSVNQENTINSDLILAGKDLEIIVENNYYKDDLSSNNKSEGKSHISGQLNELMIKMDFNQLLVRGENRMHWAPNFQKLGEEFYNTIAGWDHPQHYLLNEGPYLIYTQRKDLAPDHSEILLSASYKFYAGLPYFKFFSSMNIQEDVTLTLLRNDEMTMDSLFTNIAYQNNTGQIVDLPFADRYTELENNPIDNNSPWLCFYNEEKGYAFGSIRIKYDNTNQSGLDSPTYLPYTKISDGAGGGKYWNRRLINDHAVYVPKGSSYVEENAYLVFKINREDKYKKIVEWMNVIKNPLKVFVINQ